MFATASHDAVPWAAVALQAPAVSGDCTNLVPIADSGVSAGQWW